MVVCKVCSKTLVSTQPESLFRDKHSRWCSMQHQKVACRTRWGGLHPGDWGESVSAVPAAREAAGSKSYPSDLHHRRDQSLLYWDPDNPQQPGGPP